MDFIKIRGARQNNLKNIDIDIPRREMVVVTGLSGSGKSSLAFDTIYAEGQRRYVESLSAYARQFLGKMQKPDVDKLTGIPPAIAIEQKTTSRNPRSTVGTVTEIYEYLKLLFARIGRTYSPVSGKEVVRHSIQDVVNTLMQQDKGTRVMLLSPIVLQDNRTLAQQLQIWNAEGFSRLFHLEEHTTCYLADMQEQDFSLREALYLAQKIPARLLKNLKHALHYRNRRTSAE